MAAPAARHAWLGFSLVETLIAVAIAALLATIAYPSYVAQIQKSRRADAIVALLAVQQAQERWRADNPSYADTLVALGVPDATRHHRLRIVDRSEAGYTATATAIADGACTTLSLTLRGGNTLHGATGPAGAARCWNR